MAQPFESDSRGDTTHIEFSGRGQPPPKIGSKDKFAGSASPRESGPSSFDAEGDRLRERLADQIERDALREAREETGLPVWLHPSAPRPLDVDVHSIPARADAPAHLHLDVRFLVVAEPSAILAMDAAEVADVRWFALEQALKQASDASLRRLLLKASPYLV